MKAKYSKPFLPDTEIGFWSDDLFGDPGKMQTY